MRIARWYSCCIESNALLFMHMKCYFNLQVCLAYYKETSASCPPPTNPTDATGDHSGDERWQPIRSMWFHFRFLCLFEKSEYCSFSLYCTFCVFSMLSSNMVIGLCAPSSSTINIRNK